MENPLLDMTPSQWSFWQQKGQNNLSESLEMSLLYHLMIMIDGKIIYKILLPLHSGHFGNKKDKTISVNLWEHLYIDRLMKVIEGNIYY